jgi:hypothetical protein
MDHPRLQFAVWSTNLVLSLITAFAFLVLADHRLAGDPAPDIVLAFKLLFILEVNLITLTICVLDDIFRQRAHVIRLRLRIPF